MPQLYMIIPVGGRDGNHPDQGLPGGRPPHVGGRPPQGGGPIDPGYGQGDRPDHPWWGGTGSDRPDQGLPIQPPQGGTPVEDYQPLPPPEDIYSQYVVSVWNPKTASWTTKSYAPR